MACLGLREKNDLKNMKSLWLTRVYCGLESFILIERVKTIIDDGKEK